MKRSYLVRVVWVRLVKLAVFLLILVAIGLGVVPILVLVDLLTGGTGWGLCPGGIELCSRPYSTGAELVVILTLGLFLTVGGIRLLLKLVIKLKNDSYQVTR